MSLTFQMSQPAMVLRILLYECLEKFCWASPVDSPGSRPEDWPLSSSFKRFRLWCGNAELLVGDPANGLLPSTPHLRLLNRVIVILLRLSNCLDDYSSYPKTDITTEQMNCRIDSWVGCLTVLSLLEAEDEDMEDYDDSDFGDEESVFSCEDQRNERSNSTSPSPDLEFPNGSDEDMGLDEAVPTEAQLVRAVLARDLDAVKELVNGNYSFNSEEDVGVGNAALMAAAGERGHSELVRRLVQSGVNVNSQDSYGRTALFNAVRCGSRSTIKVLLFHGIDETLSDEDGMTALKTAIEEGNRDIINMLFRPSIYKLFVPPYRETPLEWAHAHNHQAAVQIFLEMQKRGLQRKSQSGSKSDEDDMEDNYVEATGNTISGQGWHALINPLLEQSFDINCVMTLTQDEFPVRYLAFAQDGKDLVASNVSAMMTWSTENWRVRHRVPGLKAAVVWDGVGNPLHCLCISPDGQTAVVSCDDTVQVWDPATWLRRERLNNTKLCLNDFEPVTLLDLSTSGRYLAIGRGEGTIDVYSVHTMIKVREFPTGEYISCLRISPNDRFVAACCGGTFRLYDLHTGERSWGPCGNLQCAASVDFSPDGRYLVIGGLEYLEVWDLERRRRVHRIPNQWYRICKVAFTPHGRWIAAASTDGCVRFWDWTTGQLQFILRAHTSEVRAMAFGQDGQFATACADQTVRVWSYQLRREKGGKGQDEAIVPQEADSNMSGETDELEESMSSHLGRLQLG